MPSTLPVPGAASRAAFERASQVLPGGSSRSSAWFAPHAPFAQRGQGCWITDVDGNRILDASNNYFSLIHGHAFPPVVQALHETIENGTAFAIPTGHESELARLVTSRSRRCKQVRFCNSGTEAVMNAVKAARAVTGKSAIAKFEGAFHGSYDDVEVSIASDPSNWSDAHGNPASVVHNRGTPAGVAQEVVVLPYGDPERCRSILAAEGHRLAAVLVDPISSKIAMVPPSQDLLAVLREACAKHGMLLVCDEVVSFRLAAGGAHEALGLEPDFVTLGKIIGGGLPVGAVTGPAERMKVFDHTSGKPGVNFAGTFSANPLTMAAGLAALTAYDPPAIDRLNALGDRLRQQVSHTFDEANLPAQITGSGSLSRLHLTRSPVVDYRTAYNAPPAKKALEAIHAATLRRGVLLPPNCSIGLSTPMEMAEVEQVAQAVVEAVEEVFATASVQGNDAR